MHAMIEPRLSIPEELLLLALHDEKGTVSTSASYQHALGGGIIAELILAKRIRLDRPKKKHLVDVVDREPRGEPLLDECMERISDARHRKSVGEWVGRFAGISRLRHRVAEGLCAKGVLVREEGTVLLVFTRQLYPTVNPAPERDLLERLRRAVFQEDVSDERTLIVVSLAHRTGLLGLALGKKEVRARKAWINEMIAGDAVGHATKEAVQAAQAAAISVITTATT